MASIAGIPVLALVLGAGAFLTVVLLGLAFSGGGDRDLKRRVTRIGAGGEGTRQASTGKAPASLRLEQKDSANPTLDRLVKTLVPNPERIRDRLARTGRRIPLGEYLLANAVLAVVVWTVLAEMLDLPGAVALAGGVGLGVGLPHLVVKLLGDRRVGAFVGQLPDAIDLICRGLRSGLPVTESINAVGREMPEPLGLEFRRVVDAVRLGKSMDAALWDVARRIDVPEFRFLIIAMAIQRETGGNLAETLSNLGDLLRKRRQLKLKIRALSAEARASAYIIGALPFLVFGLIYMINPAYMDTFFQDPRGVVMGAVALGMIAFGAFVMFKMVRFET